MTQKSKKGVCPRPKAQGVGGRVTFRRQRGGGGQRHSMNTSAQQQLAIRPYLALLAHPLITAGRVLHTFTANVFRSSARCVDNLGACGYTERGNFLWPRKRTFFVPPRAFIGRYFDFVFRSSGHRVSLATRESPPRPNDGRKHPRHSNTTEKKKRRKKNGGRFQ